VATAASILKYDLDLNLIGEISHPHIAGLHEIHVDDHGIWVTSTAHDLVMQLDPDGEVLFEWWGSECQPLQHSLGYTGRNLNPTLDFPSDGYEEHYEKYCGEERLHINTVAVTSSAVYVLANRQKSLIRIRPEPAEVIVRDPLLASPHNGVTITGNRFLINDTGNQLLRLYDDSGRRIRSLSTKMHHGKTRSKQFALPGWQRGLAHVTDSRFLVGTSPASIFEVDIEKEVIGQICVVDEDVNHCIHGLTVVHHR
jgi:hypothetical protein